MQSEHASQSDVIEAGPSKPARQTHAVAAAQSAALSEAPSSDDGTAAAAKALTGSTSARTSAGNSAQELTAKNWAPAIAEHVCQLRQPGVEAQAAATTAADLTPSLPEEPARVRHAWHQLVCSQTAELLCLTSLAKSALPVPFPFAHSAAPLRSRRLRLASCQCLSHARLH
jgi:hypothetical protein